MDLQDLFDKLAWCKPAWGYLTMSRETNELLKQCAEVPKVDPSDDIEQIIERSKAFPIPFPIETVSTQSDTSSKRRNSEEGNSSIKIKLRKKQDLMWTRV